MMRTIRILLLILTYAGLPMAAQATVIAVSVAPSSREVSIGSGSSVTVTWSVTASVAPPTTVRIYSSLNEFRIAGTPVANARTISRTFKTNATTPTFTIVDTIAIPRSVVIQAQRSGGALQLAREFTDDGVTTLGDEVDLIIGGSSDELGISDLTVNFEDGSAYTSAALKQPLHAVATLVTSGTGNLRAVWEVADESGTSGNPFWRPLRNISRPIGGNPEITLKSPPLPTESLGRQRVRLRIVEPQGFASGTPELTYFVVENVESDLPAFTPKVPAKEGGGLR